MIFTKDDVTDTPVLTEWQLTGSGLARPQVFGCHAFHEGQRFAAAEIVAVDPLLRSVLTAHGGYRLAGGGSLGMQRARFGAQKHDH